MAKLFLNTLLFSFLNNRKLLVYSPRPWRLFSISYKLWDGSLNPFKNCNITGTVLCTVKEPGLPVIYDIEQILNKTV